MEGPRFDSQLGPDDFTFLSPKLTSSLEPPAHLHQIDTKKATIQFLTINALSRVSIDLEFRSQTFLSLQKTFLLWLCFSCVVYCLQAPPPRENVTEARMELLEQNLIETQHTFSAYVAELRERVSILEQNMQQQQTEGNRIVPDNQIETPPAIHQPPYFDFPPTYHPNETIPPSHYPHYPLYFPSNLPSHTPRPSPPLTPPPG